MTETKQKTILTEATYEKTKTFVQSVIPVTGSLYFVLSWPLGFPNPTVVLGVLALISMVLGITLRASSRNYYNSPYSYDGEMVVIADGGGVRTFSLEVHGDPDDLAYKSAITFKVRKTDVPEPPE